MADHKNPLMALADQTGQPSIASRFETQTVVDENKVKRDQEWKEAYARIGQEPPKHEDAVQDGRTLAEKLQAHKDSKKEEWDEKMKLSNQYRGLDNEELSFLAEKARERRLEEKAKEEIENAEVREYREALAAKNAAFVAASTPAAGPSTIKSPPLHTTTSTSSALKIPLKPAKKDVKSLMKGIVVKKKPKPAAAPKADIKVTALDSGVKRKADGEQLVDNSQGEESKKSRIDPS